MASALCCVADRANGGPDIGVRGTAAEIATHPLGDLGVTRRVALVEQGDRGHDLAGGTVAALECVLRNERPLHGVKSCTTRHALDGGYLAALAGDGERQAGEPPPAIDPDGARAAGAVVTSLLGPGEVQALAQ